MRLIDTIIDPGNSSNWDASEIVFYAIYAKKTVINEDIFRKHYKSIFSTDNYFNLYIHQYTYAHCKGVCTSLDYFETGFAEKWLTNKIDKQRLEDQILSFLKKSFDSTAPILSCICEWPNDADFLGKYFAKATHLLLTEFRPSIIVSTEYSNDEWIGVFKNLKRQVTSKYDIIDL